MKTLRYLIAILLSLALFDSCKKDPAVNIETFEITKENMTIGAKTVNIMGMYSYSGTIDGITACVSENEYNFNVEEFPAELNGKNFRVDVTGLTPGTTYYYYYSVDYGMKDPYRTEMNTFTTSDYTMPTVITATVSFVGHDNAICGGEVTDDGGSDVTARGLCWGQQPNPSLNDNHSVDSCGMGVFTTHITGLSLNTKYYVRAYATNEKGTAYGSEMEFTTSAQTPMVTTMEVTEVDTTSARVKCEVASDGGSTVTERGVCWSRQHEPTLDDDHLSNGSGLGIYACRLTGLESNTEYYVRAYAKNASGTAFGEVLTFTTGTVITLPSVTTVEVSEVTATTAVCLGNVSSDGGAEVTERGACWSTNQNPTISSSHANSGTGTGEFTVQMTGLTANKTYYVRAYAKNSKGVAYGEQKTFATAEGLPVVSTGSVTDITATSAKCSGNVSDQGASAVTERGICWGTSHNPTISGNHATNGTGTGLFVCSMTGLTPNTTYYVRAYAKNNQGTSYGSEVSFMALEGLPSVTTGSVTDITATTAKCSGNVTDQGASTVTERGICWATTHNPTISNSHANSGTGAGTYTCTMTGLTNGTTYYVRAYAKNTQGTTYGEEREFSTLANLPTVSTAEVTNITQTSATGGGNVTADGGATVTERGICWSTSQNPTINGNHASNGSGTGTFSVNMTSLAPGTTYYVRAYATNSAGTAYGSQKSFTTTASMPTVTTGQVTNITQTTALGSGNVTSDGGASVTARGVCWSTSHSPTVSGSHASGGTGTGSFTANITGLTANTTYYVRAYATNSQGTSYGSEVSFTTAQNVSAPTVTTSQVTNIQQTTAVGGGNVTSDGGASVTERGICWSTSHNPTTSGSHANSGTGTGSFTVNMTGLTANTTYYVRAYAINSAGTSYGSEVSFTTQQAITVPTVTTSQVTNIQQTSATGGGNVTNSGGANVTERGICWGTSHNPTTSGSHASNGTGTGSYTVNMSGLSPGTTYYVRAYAINSQGTAYGSEVTFTTAAGLPTVTTSQVTNITQTSATGGGNVTATGGANVTERGICWSTSHNPTTSGSHANSGTGTGSFTVNMTGLTANTTYYVRAYAINSAGTSYGSEVSFTTQQAITVPTVTTSQVTNIQQTSATGGGNVTNSGGANVTERGICWGTSHNPTTSGSHASNGTGTGSYSVNMSGLSPGTTYYVRAYAINSQGTAYGSEVTFMTTAGLPTVTTSQVTNITQTSATGGGNVTATGGANVTERGICWGTSHNPTTSNSHANNGTGTGTYTVNMTSLTANTIYYVRAYAINSAGTAYGSEVSFTTSDIPSYTIAVSANPSSGGTVSGGGTYQQGQSCTVTASANTGYTFLRWTENGSQVSTNANYTFTVSGNRTLVAQFQAQSYTISVSANPSNGGTVSGGGSYNYGQTCTVTASANSGYEFTNWTEGGSVVSSNASYSFTVSGNRTLVANFETSVPIGAINGLFTINANGDQVYFSQGNLQYIGSASTPYWKFADNQWDVLGTTTGQNSSDQNVDRDLFGWGTSGWNNGNTYYRPWDTNNSGGYSYGPDGLYDLTGTYANADWGVYNPISNGGNQANQWRTLTKDEWTYVFNSRTTSSGIRYAKAKVNAVNGVILLPDDWSSVTYSLSNTNSPSADFSSNTISASQWNTLEQAGAVFLPAAGLRIGTSVSYVGSYCYYWSASYGNGSQAYGVYFYSISVSLGSNDYRYCGYSVRLARNYNR